MKDIREEKWADIEGYEGLYQVSNLGRVKSLNYARSGKEKVMSPRNNYLGYSIISLYKNKKRTQALTHRLVAKAFPEICGEWFEGCEIDHIDLNPRNNRAENLRVCTHKENMNNKLTRQKMSKSQIENWKNEEYRTKKTDITKKNWQNPEIRKKYLKPVYQLDKESGEIIREWESGAEASRFLGINSSCISASCHKSNRTAAGYKWVYKETVA